MRNRMLAFLGVLTVLAFFTGLKAAEALPSHPYAAMAGALGLVAVFVGWMAADRNGPIREGTRASRVRAWAASGAMALWATFLLLSAVSSLAELVLAAAPGGAAGTGYWGPANRFGVPSEITVLILTNDSSSAGSPP